MNINPKAPLKAKVQPEIDPIEQAAYYVNHKWLQNLAPAKTECFSCHQESPLVFIPVGTVTFGNKLSKQSRDRDVTDEAILAFAAVGWKFQHRRSYCPICKDMGSI